MSVRLTLVYEWGWRSEMGIWHYPAAKDGGVPAEEMGSEVVPAGERVGPVHGRLWEAATAELEARGLRVEGCEVRDHTGRQIGRLRVVRGRAE